MNDILQLLQTNNPVFAGGLGLGLLALGAQGFRAGYSTGFILLKRHFLVTLEITSKDRAYPWVLQWLSMHSKKNQHISVETSFKPLKNIIDNNKTKPNLTFTMATTPNNSHRNNNSNNDNNNNNIASSIFDFVPGPGQHFIWYKHMLINVQRFREQQMLDLNTGKPWEKMQFTAIGRDTKPFESILQEAFLLACLKEVGKTTIYTNWGSEWRPFGNPRQHRPLSSVILDENISDTILRDILEFKNSASWYTDRGIPYRRGYLLHGPPGSGKSSFILALAGHLSYNICILNLAERGLTDDRLALTLSCVPPQSIVLLEDIDAAFPSRITSSNSSGSNNSNNNNQPSPAVTGAAAGSSGSSGTGLPQYNKAIHSSIHQQSHSSSDVTFSGLLNVIDGVASSEERILFMTTNHIERLDPALIRPGRVDLTQCIGDASAYQMRCMFVKFYMQSYNTSNNNGSYSSKDINTTTAGVTGHQGNFTAEVSSSSSSPSSSASSPYLLSLQEEFVNKIMSSGASISMARLQGHFMCHKHSPSQAVATVHELLPSLPSAVIYQQSPVSTSTTTSSSSSSQLQHQQQSVKSSFSQQNLTHDDEDEEEVMNATLKAKKNAIKGKGKRMLTVQEVDKMIFNPQPGWDQNNKSI